MFGQAIDVPSPAPPVETRSAEEIAFEERSRAGYSYRYATAAWYAMSMAILKRHIVIGAEILPGDVMAVLTVMATHEPELWKTEQSGIDWVKNAQAAGDGVVLIPREKEVALVRTKDVALASKLTHSHENAFVLSEPKEGWDVMTVHVGMVNFVLLAAMGFVGALLLMRRIR